MTVIVVGKIVNGVKFTKHVENGSVICNLSKMDFPEKTEVVKETSLSEILRNRATKIEAERNLDVPNFMKERSLRLEQERFTREQNKIVRFPKRA